MTDNSMIESLLELSHYHWWNNRNARAAFYWDEAIKLGWVPKWPKPGSPEDLRGSHVGIDDPDHISAYSDKPSQKESPQNVRESVPSEWIR